MTLLPTATAAALLGTAPAEASPNFAGIALTCALLLAALMLPVLLALEVVARRRRKQATEWHQRPRVRVTIEERYRENSDG